jgi:hypothetical protein
LKILLMQSTTAYITFLGGNLVIWKIKKQTVVVWSSVEAKCRAMARTARGAHADANVVSCNICLRIRKMHISLLHIYLSIRVIFLLSSFARL